MLGKIKTMPHKNIFALGLAIILISNLISDLFGIWTMVAGGIFAFVGTLLVLYAHDKKFKKVK